jgi:hypothetical protein
MSRIPLSPAAAALLRALIARSGVSRDRILLSEAESVDWCSLTFTGERHQLQLRVAAPDSRVIMQHMCVGLEDAEFSLPGILVADIAMVGAPRHGLDGSTSLTSEALTITAD